MSWDLIDTPNPDEDAIRIWVEDSKALKMSGHYEHGVTTLAEFELSTAPVSEGIGEFVFVRKLGREGSRRGFVFANNSAASRGTPFETYTEQGNHYWHPQLKKVAFFQDYNFPVGTNSRDGGVVLASRIYNRHIYVPGVSEGTLFVHELFYAGAKFTIGQSPVPVPTAVQWDYHDSQGRFEECLHPKMKFPALRSAREKYTTGGGTVAAAGAAPGQVFPATNFESWVPYTLYDKQRPEETGWFRERVTVHPPEEPELIKA